MDLVRRFSTEAPAARPFHEDKPTLLVCWWCTVYAISIILFRICGRYIRAEKLFLDDKIMLGSIIPLLGHMAFIHVVLLFGTNNALTEGLSEEDINRRQIGSGLVIWERILEAAYLWTIKYSTLMFLRSLTEQVRLRSHRLLLYGTQILFGLTLLAVLISTIAECHPFPNYWRVVPDPGPSCRQAPAQFIVLATAHILTNVALVVFPIPIILKANIPLKRKISTLLLLSLPIFNVVYTLGTIHMVTSSLFVQHTRSLLGSLDVLLNAFWSNAVVLCALLQDKGFKKAKYKHRFEHDPNDKNHFATANSKAKTKTRGREPWDSDEELIMGGTVGGSSSRGESRVAVGVGVREASERNSAIEMMPLPATKMPAKSGSIRVAQTWEVQIEELAHPGRMRGD